MWEVTWERCTGCGTGAPPAPLSALVQIDRFSSFGAEISNCSFHDSYNNFGRFAASNLIFRDNSVARCEDGAHVSDAPRPLHYML
jgi:hypothetical protein